MSIPYLLLKLMKPYETNMIQSVTRQEMVSFLRDRLIEFESLKTRDERAQLVSEIFTYLFIHFDKFQEFFSNELRLIYTVASKCAEMKRDPVVVRHYPNVTVLASKLLKKVKKLITDVHNENADG